MTEYISLKNILPADRDMVASALFRAGYTVRLAKRKDEKNKTVIYIEYKEEKPHG